VTDPKRPHWAPNKRSIVKKHKPYDRTKHDGNVVNWRTKAMLLEAEERLGYKLTVVQGSYNPGGVAASAGTHDGGGAVDLTVYDLKRKLKVLKDVGFAAWHRPALPGVWGEHIHAVAIGDRELASLAASQVKGYLEGRDGLGGYPFGPDPSYRPASPVVFNFYRWQRERVLAARLRRLLRRREALTGNIKQIRAELRKVRH